MAVINTVYGKAPTVADEIEKHFVHLPLNMRAEAKASVELKLLAANIDLKSTANRSVPYEQVQYTVLEILKTLDHFPNNKLSPIKQEVRTLDALDPEHFRRFQSVNDEDPYAGLLSDDDESYMDLCLEIRKIFSYSGLTILQSGKRNDLISLQSILLQTDDASQNNISNLFSLVKNVNVAFLNSTKSQSLTSWQMESLRQVQNILGLYLKESPSASILSEWLPKTLVSIVTSYSDSSYYFKQHFNTAYKVSKELYYLNENNTNQNKRMLNDFPSQFLCRNLQAHMAKVVDQCLALIFFKEKVSLSTIQAPTTQQKVTNWKRALVNSEHSECDNLRLDKTISELMKSVCTGAKLSLLDHIHTLSTLYAPQTVKYHHLEKIQTVLSILTQVKEIMTRDNVFPFTMEQRFWREKLYEIHKTQWLERWSQQLANVQKFYEPDEWAEQQKLEKLRFLGELTSDYLTKCNFRIAVKDKKQLIDHFIKTHSASLENESKDNS